MKKINFYQAGKRHYNSAQNLKNNNHDGDALLLYGYCAECCIKEILIKSNIIKTHKNGDIKTSEYRKHMDDLIRMKHDLKLKLKGREGGKYTPIIKVLNLFNNWEIDHRYFCASSLPLASLNNYQRGASTILAILEKYP